MYKYFTGRISHGFVSVYSGRMVLRISVNLIHLFMPIFLYKLFEFNLAYVIYYYLGIALVYGTFVPLGAKFLNVIGLRRSLQISIFWGAFYYFIFYLLDKYTNDGSLVFEPSLTNPVLWMLVAGILTTSIFRMMYWVPIHTDIAKFTDKKNRAKQLSLIEATTIVIGTIMPILAGWIIVNYNYDVLFLIAVIIFMMAIIPFLTLPRTKEKFSWGYWQAWREFFSKKRRRIVIAYLGDGAEGVAGIVIWPIFIWNLLDGNYFDVGAISSLIVLATVFMQLIVGRFADVVSKDRMLHISSIFYALGWVAKIFIASAFQIFIASTYHNLTKIFTRTSFDALNYEKAADQGHFVDEYTVIHEMAIQYGKIIMFVFILFLIPRFDIQWIFLIAGFASLFMNFLADDRSRDLHLALRKGNI